MKKLSLILLLICISVVLSQTDKELEAYCTYSGGKVINMTAAFDTNGGYVAGNSKKFCRIESKDHNLGYIGLDTLGSRTPSLAATYAKTMTISQDKYVTGQFSTENLNLCYALGGANIVYFLTDGGFADEFGLCDICIFGDNSAVAAWTLLYMMMGLRTDIKTNIVADNLQIPLPTIPLK